MGLFGYGNELTGNRGGGGCYLWVPPAVRVVGARGGGVR